MKIDEFRGPFGSTHVMKSVIFMKFQRRFGSCRRFGQVDLAKPGNGFGDLQGRPTEASPRIGVSHLGARDPLWG